MVVQYGLYGRATWSIWSCSVVYTVVQRGLYGRVMWSIWSCNVVYSPAIWSIWSIWSCNMVYTVVQHGLYGREIWSLTTEDQRIAYIHVGGSAADVSKTHGPFETSETRRHSVTSQKTPKSSATPLLEPQIWQTSVHIKDEETNYQFLRKVLLYSMDQYSARHKLYEARQETYVKVTLRCVRACDHCCSGKTISMTYS
jgi:hypothetical protein